LIMRVLLPLVLMVLGGCATGPWPRIETVGARSALTVPWVELSAGKDTRPVVVMGVVHVAEPAFFAEVRDATQRCSLVLVEGVTPKGSAFEAPLARYERALEELADALGLVAQHRVLEPRSWWRNADISEDDFARDVDIDAVTAAMRSDTALLRAEASLDAARARFVRGLVAAPSDDGFLIETRNTAALRALPTDGVGRIGLVYGAHHVPDLVARLEARGYSITRTKWIPVMTYAESSSALR